MLILKISSSKWWKMLYEKTAIKTLTCLEKIHFWWKFDCKRSLSDKLYLIKELKTIFNWVNFVLTRLPEQNNDDHNTEKQVRGYEYASVVLDETLDSNQKENDSSSNRGRHKCSDVFYSSKPYFDTPELINKSERNKLNKLWKMLKILVEILRDLIWDTMISKISVEKHDKWNKKNNCVLMAVKKKSLVKFVFVKKISKSSLNVYKKQILFENILNFCTLLHQKVVCWGLNKRRLFKFKKKNNQEI